jgi:2-hydroxychromene-2-carboxylate isomerase
MKPAVSRLVTSLLTSRRRLRLQRAIRDLGRRLTGRPAVVDYFHQVDDPYSHLAAQMLPRLAERYRVRFRCWLVPPPEDSAAPERGRLNAYALRDAPRLAAEYGLDFPGGGSRPDDDALDLAGRTLAAALKSGRFADPAVRVGAALWRADHAALLALALDAASSQALAEALAEGRARRKRLGHYLGAMFYFEGEWFWGVDRLNHLEERLAGLGLDKDPSKPPLAPFRDMQLGAVPTGGRPAEIEIWFSFRSPYSWIALPRVRRLARHYGAALTLRYILPMVMRGLPVPRVKTLYITLDTKREADRVGLPFGRIVDPVGAGAERALAVLHHAVKLGRGEAFAELGTRAAFADGIALAEDAGLYDVARRAGLTDQQTAAALADDGWRSAAEVHRLTLFEAGLWGAPTYRVNGGPAHWGQDRLWALEQDLIRAMSAT